MGRSGRRSDAEAEAQGELLDDYIDEVVEQAEVVNYPPVVVEEELDRRIESLREQVTRAGWQWDDYLMLQGESEASLREEWEESAIENVERGLIFRRFIELEKLSISEEELDVAIDERLERFGDREELGQQMRDFFRQGQGLEMISSEILVDKVHERVKAIVTGNAPDLAELEAAAADEAVAEEEE